MATVGMGGLRESTEDARLRGKSEEYVSGVASRSKTPLPARIQVVVVVLGLAALGFGGTLRRVKAP